MPQRILRTGCEPSVDFAIGFYVFMLACAKVMFRGGDSLTADVEIVTVLVEGRTVNTEKSCWSCWSWCGTASEEGTGAQVMVLVTFSAAFPDAAVWKENLVDMGMWCQLGR